MTTIAAQRAPLQAHDLFAQIDRLYQDVRTKGQERYDGWAARIERRSFLPSAHNLAHYLAFRNHDLRDVQDALAALGLSSLGRSEAHVLPTIRAVRATLAALCGVVDAAVDRPTLRDFALGEQLLERNTRAIFGPAIDERAHIMVTLPTEAGSNFEFVRTLVGAGMDCARINCAHDTAATWRSMAANVRRAAQETQRSCRVYMDLAGPKIRTAATISHDPERRFIIGERFVLAKPDAPSHPELAQIACTEPAVFATLCAGAPVWINDGKIGATVIDSKADHAVLEVTHAGGKGKKIGPDKGLNFPQTRVEIDALTAKDHADLDEVVAAADIVGQSFVRDARDVDALIAELERRNKRLPIVAKIETAEAVHNLPEILVAGAGKVPFGAMIARGDLAVEIGYKRLAEMQEELLWLCEAAHVPVIWATQVLDQLVRKGLPSRAEITDAAMAERAECVMLNKGPFLVEAIGTLADVLVRMQGHQSKKTARLRALQAWN
ncbi:MAG TPA: pyruvate kinase [Candidatus Binatia bacterium]|nr:pyruvate kinase [Candidatus Binatia bacterium]